MTHPIDTRLRDAWHDAGQAVTPAMRGRLRAARRTALSGAHRADGAAARPGWGLQWIGMPAAALAAVVAVALLVPRGDDVQVTPVVSVQQPAVAVDPIGDPVPVGTDPLEVLALEDDPDFYLWLASDAAPTHNREVTNESI